MMKEEQLKEWEDVPKLYYDTVDDAVEMLQDCVRELIPEIRRLQAFIDHLGKPAQFTAEHRDCEIISFNGI